MTTPRLIRIAHSPDSDDAFMFHALANGKIAPPGWRFEHVLADIETLNQRAFEGMYEVTAVSIHAYAHLRERYALLASGASMGDGYGPMIVARQRMRLADLKGKTIAVPGLLTSAVLALKLVLGKDIDMRVMNFKAIGPAVLSGEVEAGLLIHEGQLTYQRDGLVQLINLGEWWAERTNGLPLPLGGNAIRRDLGPDIMVELAGWLRASIEYALAHRPEALDHAMRYAGDLDRGLADRFVGMYVNQLTVDYGARGREAVQRFIDESATAGLIPEAFPVEFVG